MRHAARFCSFITVSVLVAVPALQRLHHHQHQHQPAFSASFASSTTVIADDDQVKLTAEQISRRAEPILARLVPAFLEDRKVIMTLGGGVRADGSTQHVWYVHCTGQQRTGQQRNKLPTDADSVASETSAFVAELRYDGETGELVYASTQFGIDNLFVPGRRTLTAKEAITAARSALLKLELSKGEPYPPVLFPPNRFCPEYWQVWLRGRDTGGKEGTGDASNGSPLTVQLTINALTGDLRTAIVVERAVFPRMYLPRKMAGHPVSQR